MIKNIQNLFFKVLAIFSVATIVIGLLPFQSVKAEDIIFDDNVAAQTVSDMGIGWNLGNTMDAWSQNMNSYELGIQKRDKYQMMATYSTKYYSGWDSSSVPYFSSTTSSCELNWNITKLNSSLTKACGTFAFQLINNDIGNTGTNTVNFTVTKAQFTTASGTVIPLTDIMATYSKPITNKVTTYVVADLSKLTHLATSADILGGKLTIAVKINTYPMPQSSSITKEKYYETLWGNPVTTKAMIDKVKAAGFGSVRIPITFTNHMDAQGNIDQAWLNRIAEVVKYVMDNNMYCIIDMHHDTGANGWLRADLSTIKTTGAKFKTAWNQIAFYFKDYDQKLLFEGYNEILNTDNKWSWAGSDSYSAANQLNQIFVDTVRSTGGNNSSRCLLVTSYAASTEAEVLSNFVLPTDSIKNRLIVDAHYYGTSQTSINTVINRLNDKFVSKGIPFIIGEFGISFKSSEAERVSYANYVVSTAAKYNITCFWWDDGNYANRIGAQCNFALLDRCALTWYSHPVVNALINASNIQ